MSTFCSTSPCNAEQDTTVGTSTNCSAVCSAKRTRRLRERREKEILGTSITCSGMRKSSSQHTSTSWFFHLRHRNVKRRHEERVVDVLFHGAPLNPFLRPDLVKPVRPRAPEFFLVQREELGIPGHTRRLAPKTIARGLCTGGPLSLWGHVQVAPLTSLTAVVSGRRQCHCDGLLLMTPLSTQPPLPSPPRGASAAFSHQRPTARVHLAGATKNKRAGARLG